MALCPFKVESLGDERIFKLPFASIALILAKNSGITLPILKEPKPSKPPIILFTVFAPKVTSVVGKSFPCVFTGASPIPQLIPVSTEADFLTSIIITSIRTTGTGLSISFTNFLKRFMFEAGPLTKKLFNS